MIEDVFAVVACAVGAIVGGALLLLGIVLPIRQLDHHYSVSSCHGFASASGYKTKFVDYNFWDYDCLGQMSDGRWVSIDHLHDVNVEGGK